MPITIRDVARKLNLSITTVSRALDGYDDVAEETRQNVIRIAREMGYAPNRAARQLRRQRTDTIGYILPARPPRFNEPFYTEFIAGLGDEATLHNYDLLVSTASPGEEAEIMVYQRWVQGRKVDGLVLNRIRLEDWRVQYLYQSGIPFVSLERSRYGVDHPYIEVDGKTGFKVLIAHLVDRGHQRIAYIGGRSELKIQADRYAGYQEGLTAAGLPTDPALVIGGEMTREGGYEAAQRLFSLSQPPSAIACVNDLMAMGALEAANSRGLTVGRELAIAGFDGIEESAYTHPPLTTVTQPLYDIARRLVKMLAAEIAGQPLEERHVLIQPELVVRESTTG